MILIIIQSSFKMNSMKTSLVAALLMVLYVSQVLADGGKRFIPYKEVKGKDEILRYQCQTKKPCWTKQLKCPKECPDRKPGKKNQKGCYVDCTPKCGTSCRTRKPNCEGYGDVCYDPQFVGGDGRMFYFHVSKGRDFALFSDDDLHINAHFIGIRPEGRTRDFTWVQALSVIFDTHTIVVAAKKVAHWHDSVADLVIRWNGDSVEVPMNGEAEWRISTEEGRQVVVERTEERNTIKLTVTGLLEVNVKVASIENGVHKYQSPSDDAFVHLETEFTFVKLSDMAKGLLGQTYRPAYVSLLKTGVAMPLMGGEDKYRTLSLLSPVCKACRFKGLQYSTTSVQAS